jgi:hypothetical protein
MSEQQLNPPASFTRRVLALFLDFLTIFFSAGYLIAWQTGALTSQGFQLKGAPALALLAIVGVYFYGGWKIVRGTIWDRILGIARPQPSGRFAVRVLALLLDFFTIAFSAGYLIAWLTRDLTPQGFNLRGVPALACFGIVGVYFYVGWKIAGGTIWDRVFGITRPQPY